MDIAGVILAGGKNTRMNGRKKITLPLDSGSFLDALLQALSVLDSVYLSVEDAAPYRHLGLPLVVDRYTEIGPIGGITSVLESVPEESILVVPCDLPLLGQEHISLLLADFLKHRQPVFFSDSAGRINPLAGIYPKAALALLQEQIAARRYRMSAVVDRLPCRAVIVEERALFNVNDPSALQALEEL